ncbi:putative quinol monooxygenase [Pseudotabrizicola sp. L79]|uniref:putative quinol monooxygenase n=1 Tax=Pseudotabrizicola sp. L79 TaxID=3118402 RepID=UPI002F94F47A
MPRLTVIANIYAHPDHVDLVKTELLKLVPITRAEPGCINYDLHQNNDDPTHFTFFENWETRESWETHMKAPHITAYLAATDSAVSKFAISGMTQID